jgi:WD40 repeat protein
VTRSDFDRTRLSRQERQSARYRGLGAALSPDGTLAAFAEYGNRVRVWDIAARRDRPVSSAELRNGWHALAFRSPGELVFIARDGVATVWDIAANRPARTIGRAGAFEGFHIAVSPDGRWLAAEPTPSSVAIVDLERGAVVLNFREERSPIWSFAWSPDARRLAVGLSDGGIVIWDLARVRLRLAEVGLDWPAPPASR